MSKSKIKLCDAKAIEILEAMKVSGPTVFMVHEKTRMCQMLFSPSKKDILETLDRGFIQVTQSEFDAFREETKRRLNS